MHLLESRMPGIIQARLYQSWTAFPFQISEDIVGVGGKASHYDNRSRMLSEDGISLGHADLGPPASAGSLMQHP